MGIPRAKGGSGTTVNVSDALYCTLWVMPDNTKSQQNEIETFVLPADLVYQTRLQTIYKHL